MKTTKRISVKQVMARVATRCREWEAEHGRDGKMDRLTVLVDVVDVIGHVTASERASALLSLVSATHPWLMSIAEDGAEHLQRQSEGV